MVEADDDGVSLGIAAYGVGNDSRITLRIVVRRRCRCGAQCCRGRCRSARPCPAPRGPALTAPPPPPRCPRTWTTCRWWRRPSCRRPSLPAASARTPTARSAARRAGRRSRSRRWWRASSATASARGARSCRCGAALARGARRGLAPGPRAAPPHPPRARPPPDAQDARLTGKNNMQCKDKFRNLCLTIIQVGARAGLSVWEEQRHRQALAAGLASLPS
jgi:hypothetical protein